MTTSRDDPRPAAERDDDPLAETRIAGTQVYDGALLDVRRDRARLPDGGEAVREYIVHPGAVLVVPVHDDGRMIVERQFRYPHNRSFLEFPAGSSIPGRRRSKRACVSWPRRPATTRRSGYDWASCIR